MKQRDISDNFIKFCFLFLFFISTYILLYHISSFFLTKTAVSGGEINEGIIGIPISFNPFFTTNEADQEMYQLLYMADL